MSVYFAVIYHLAIGSKKVILRFQSTVHIFIFKKLVLQNIVMLDFPRVTHLIVLLNTSSEVYIISVNECNTLAKMLSGSLFASDERNINTCRTKMPTDDWSNISFIFFYFINTSSASQVQCLQLISS